MIEIKNIKAENQLLINIYFYFDTIYAFLIYLWYSKYTILL